MILNMATVKGPDFGKPAYAAFDRTVLRLG